MHFDNNNVTLVFTANNNVNSLSCPQGYLGGVVYAINLMNFSASYNIISQVALCSGSGDIFYIYSDSAVPLIVNLTNNNFSPLSVAMTTTIANNILNIVEPSISSYAPIYII